MVICVPAAAAFTRPGQGAIHNAAGLAAGWRGGHAISPGNAEVARGRQGKAWAGDFGKKGLGTASPAGTLRPDFAATAGASLVASSHDSPHSTACHSPLQAPSQAPREHASKRHGQHDGRAVQCNCG